MSDKPKVKDYSNGEVIVHWEPRKCFHSGHCVRSMPEVFDPKRRPWIVLEGADADAVLRTVAGCPSGALRAERAEGKASEARSDGETATETRIRALPDGPLLVEDDFELTREDGATERCAGPVALCRCGASQRKPFCDGSHKKIGFETREKP